MSGRKRGRKNAGTKVTMYCQSLSCGWKGRRGAHGFNSSDPCPRCNGPVKRSETAPIEIKAVNDRGFMRGEFIDQNGERCTIQESSAMADQGMLWLGIHAPEVKIFEPYGRGWYDFDLLEHAKKLHPGKDADISVSGRMHLNQTQVRRLLPLLQYFAKTGRLPVNEIPRNENIELATND